MTNPFVASFPEGLRYFAKHYLKADSGENNKGDVTEIVPVNKLPRSGIPMFRCLANSSWNSVLDRVACEFATALWVRVCLEQFRHT